jgi:drug/metabolite transporter (DMT)-like permease
MDASDWMKGIFFSVLASVIGAGSKLAIRKSWLMEQDMQDDNHHHHNSNSRIPPGERGEYQGPSVHDVTGGRPPPPPQSSSSSSNPTTTSNPNEAAGRPLNNSDDVAAAAGECCEEEVFHDEDGDGDDPLPHQSSSHGSKAATTARQMKPRTKRRFVDRKSIYTAIHQDTSPPSSPRQQTSPSTAAEDQYDENGKADVENQAAVVTTPTTAAPAGTPQDDHDNNDEIPSTRRQSSSCCCCCCSCCTMSRFLRFCGMVGMTFLNPACCLLAMNYASPSILAPFSGLTLVWVIVFSPCLIAESPSCAQKVASTLIVLGEVMVAVFGDHTNDADSTIDSVVASYHEIPFLLYFVALVVWMGLLWWWIQYATSSKLRRFAWGTSGGSITGLAQNFIKDSLVVVKASSSLWHTPWYVPLFVAMGILSSFGGLLLLTATMKRYDATYSAAMFVGSFVVSTSIMSAVHYHTFEHLADLVDYIMYPMGLVVLMIGVSILVQAAQACHLEDDDDDAYDDTSDRIIMSTQTSSREPGEWFHPRRSRGNTFDFALAPAGLEDEENDDGDDATPVPTSPALTEASKSTTTTSTTTETSTSSQQQAGMDDMELVRNLHV